MSRERRDRQATRIKKEMDRFQKGKLEVPEVSRPVYLTTPDRGPASRPETILVRLVREEGMGFAVLMLDDELVRAKRADVPTPGRWHEPA